MSYDSWKTYDQAGEDAAQLDDFINREIDNLEQLFNIQFERVFGNGANFFELTIRQTKKYINKGMEISWSDEVINFDIIMGLEKKNNIMLAFFALGFNDLEMGLNDDDCGLWIKDFLDLDASEEVERIVESARNNI